MFHKYAHLNSLLACRDNGNIKAPRKVAMRTDAHARSIICNVKSHSPARNSYSKYQTSLLEASSACQTIGTNKDHLCPGKDGTRPISWSSMVTSFPKIFSYWHFHFWYCDVIIRAIVFSLFLWILTQSSESSGNSRVMGMPLALMTWLLRKWGESSKGSALDEDETLSSLPIFQEKKRNWRGVNNQSYLCDRAYT